MRAFTVSYGKVKGSASRWPYFQAALYETRARKDGVVTWRYLSHHATPRRSPQLAEADARTLATEHGIPFLAEIRHNKIVEPVTVQ
jgi:hypothetical protein